MCIIPGSLMLSVHVAWPVTSAGSSLRGTPPPTYLSGAWVTPYSLLRRRAALHLPGSLLHGLDDVLVAGAAAEVALQVLPDLLLRGVRVLLEEADGGHDHARRAVTALQPVRLVEGPLHRVPLAVLGDPLHGRDLAPVGLHRQYGTRLDGLAVHQHRAGSAVGGVAAGVHAPDPEVLPE